MQANRYTHWQFFKCAGRADADIIECFEQVSEYLYRNSNLAARESIVVKPGLLPYFSHLNCNKYTHVSQDLLPADIDVLVRWVERGFFRDE